MCTRAPSARFGESRAQTKGCCPGPGGAPHPAGHDGARAQKEAPGSRQQRALWSPPLSSDAGGRRAPGGPRVALRSRPGRAGGASAPAPPPRSQHPCGIRARWLWQDREEPLVPAQTPPAGLRVLQNLLEPWASVWPSFCIQEAPSATGKGANSSQGTPGPTLPMTNAPLPTAHLLPEAGASCLKGGDRRLAVFSRGLLCLPGDTGNIWKPFRLSPWETVGRTQGPRLTPCSARDGRPQQSGRARTSTAARRTARLRAGCSQTQPSPHVSAAAEAPAADVTGPRGAARAQHTEAGPPGPMGPAAPVGLQAGRSRPVCPWPAHVPSLTARAGTGLLRPATRVSVSQAQGSGPLPTSGAGSSVCRHPTKATAKLLLLTGSASGHSELCLLEGSSRRHEALTRPERTPGPRALAVPPPLLKSSDVSESVTARVTIRRGPPSPRLREKATQPWGMTSGRSSVL